MTRTPHFGSSQPVSTEDARERPKRVLAAKPALMLAQPVRPPAEPALAPRQALRPRMLPAVMGTIERLLRRLGLRHRPEAAMRLEATAREDGAFSGAGRHRAEAFERDYRAAVALLKRRMDGAHPAAFHRKLSRPGSSAYGYGERRMDVVDEASTAIAMSLREGDSIAVAADKGAARIGLPGVV